MKKNILFSISSLGLGHATRTLPVILSYLPDYSVHVICDGDALALLRRELEGTDSVFHECEDYPPLERGYGWRFYAYLLIDLVKTRQLIKREQQFVRTLVAKLSPAFIIADGRYGSYSESVFSALISHQIGFVMPHGLGFFQKLSDAVNKRAFRCFDMIIIPDYEDVSNNLAGKLSHHPMLAHLPHEYVGVLSSFKKESCKENIDMLFMTGGFLAKHKTDIATSLLERAKSLPGKKVFVLGKIEGDAHQYVDTHDIEIYASIGGQERQRLLNQAKFIVTRGGYTTIMDLIELEKPGLLLPTSGQTEQEYLAAYLSEKKYFLSSTIVPPELDHVLPDASVLTPFNAPWKTETTIQKIHDQVQRHTKQNFFSIIIPAYNEEKYIEETLKRVRDLDYPGYLFEVLIVENGSSDRTREVAEKYSSGNIRVLSSQKGVSKARNLGMENISKKSDWVIFLDADTSPEKAFLREFDGYLRVHHGQNFSVGTTEVSPNENRGYKARAWFRFYNWGHRVSKTSFAIQLMRASLCTKVQFDEELRFAEDLKFIKDLLQYGKFLYFETNTVLTSTRRFDEVGWLKQFVMWNWQALVLSKTKRKKGEYLAVR